MSCISPSRGKGLSHLELGAIVVLQVVESVSLTNQEIVANVLGMQTKETIDKAVVDEGLGKEVLAEGQSEILYLADGEGQCWREMTQDAVDGTNGNLPDAEEA